MWCDLVVAGCYAEFDNAKCVVTSGIDGKHGPHSHHYKGFARDYRIRNVREGWWEKLAARIAECLTDEFQVVLEREKLHIHVEFDPER